LTEKAAGGKILSMNRKPRLTRSGYKRIIVIYAVMILNAVIFFAAAGRLNLPRAWFYLGLTFLGQTAVFMLLFIRPEMVEVVNARGEMKLVKAWDRLFTLFYGLSTIIFIPLIAGLDVGRHNWSQLGLSWLAAGVVCYFFAMFFIEWALLENKFFETTVRVQKERGQTVVTTGPYAIVRHPGYLGMIFLYFSMPLAVGSAWALLVSLFTALLFVIRTALEDATLQKELPGYSKYVKKTRYRLVPFIW
jgi:protein-S-isoprenylcysteine O-methyltransferase Ste14